VVVQVTMGLICVTLVLQLLLLCLGSSVPFVLGPQCNPLKETNWVAQ
jgi:hypothetical protein